MTENKIEMDVMGITYSQIQAGAYALLLKQRDGDLRVPIVVGVPEAQSIAMRLEHVIPPRPLSHDLMVSVLHAYGISIDEVLIYDFQDGVFMAQIMLNDGEKQISLDSRTSDAIALAFLLKRTRRENLLCARNLARSMTTRLKNCKLCLMMRWNMRNMNAQLRFSVS